MKDLVFLGMDRTYGDSWGRPGLDMRTKSFICMTLTAALGCEDQLRSHIVAAHHTGITKDEMVEWLIHLTTRGLFGTASLTAPQVAALRAVIDDFGVDEIAAAAPDLGVFGRSLG